MAIYHIDEKGKPERCKAVLKRCPFGGPTEHFFTKKSASISFELKSRGTFTNEEKSQLVVIEEHELRIVDARLLARAIELSEASGSRVAELAAITEPLAIIRAAHVESLSELIRN